METRQVQSFNSRIICSRCCLLFQMVGSVILKDICSFGCLDCSIRFLNINVLCGFFFQYWQQQNNPVYNKVAGLLVQFLRVRMNLFVMQHWVLAMSWWSTMQQHMHSQSCHGSLYFLGAGLKFTFVPKCLGCLLLFDALILIFLLLIKRLFFHQLNFPRCVPTIMMFLFYNYRPHIRIIGDRFPWQVKSAILSTLSILIRKGGMSLRPFLPELQTTFIKCLQDSTRFVCTLKAHLSNHCLIVS